MVVCKARAVIGTEQNGSVFFVLADNDEKSSVVLPHLRQITNLLGSLRIILISQS